MDESHALLHSRDRSESRRLVTEMPRLDPLGELLARFLVADDAPVDETSQIRHERRLFVVTATIAGEAVAHADSEPVSR